MHDIVRMRLGQASRHLHSNVDRFRHLDRPTDTNSLRQRRTIVKSHHDERAPISGGFDAVDRPNIGVIQGGSDTGLLQEVLFVFFAGIDFRRQELERHRALQF